MISLIGVDFVPVCRECQGLGWVGEPNATVCEECGGSGAVTGDVIYAIDKYATNADLILACRRLGYLRETDAILDPTYGTAGGFWKKWNPPNLNRHDIVRDGVDFRDLPYPDLSFDATVFDPPYKLAGRIANEDVDRRYGLTRYESIDGRHELMLIGIMECARVTRRHLLIKCQDQVASGRVWWQTRMCADEAELHGFTLVDMLHFWRGEGRPQPVRTRKCREPIHATGPGRPCAVCGGTGRVVSGQQHARRNYSTLLVCQRT